MTISTYWSYPLTSLTIPRGEAALPRQMFQLPHDARRPKGQGLPEKDKHLTPTSETSPEHDLPSGFGVKGPQAPALSIYPPESKDEALRELYALRYRIYCQERQFMQPVDYPNELEKDTEDKRSAHFAARASCTTVIGCARLILGDTEKPFPTLAHCVSYPGFIPPAAEKTAEVSRLAVSRKCGEGTPNIMHITQPGPGKHEAPKRTAPPSASASSRQVVLDLYREMYRYSRANGIRYWYAAIEKSLWRLLARLGILFTQIGPLQDYYGPVIPCIYDLAQLDDQLERSNPELLRWFKESHDNSSAIGRSHSF